jgi:hypothetical protein
MPLIVPKEFDDRGMLLDEPQEYWQDFFLNVFPLREEGMRKIASIFAHWNARILCNNASLLSEDELAGLSVATEADSFREFLKNGIPILWTVLLGTMAKLLSMLRS